MNDIDRRYLLAAIRQGLKSAREGGIPIGAALAIDGILVGLGHNQRVQLGSQTRHAEIDCFEHAGRFRREEFDKATLYSTLMPCKLCSGHIAQFGIRRVVVADDSFNDGQKILQDEGVEIIVASIPDEPLLQEIRHALARFQKQDPATWAEDIGGSYVAPQMRRRSSARKAPRSGLARQKGELAQNGTESS